jgi:hypothetical protein
MRKEKHKEDSRRKGREEMRTFEERWKIKER